MADGYWLVIIDDDSTNSPASNGWWSSMITLVLVIPCRQIARTTSNMKRPGSTIRPYRIWGVRATAASVGWHLHHGTPRWTQLHDKPRELTLAVPTSFVLDMFMSSTSFNIDPGHLHVKGIVSMVPWMINLQLPRGCYHKRHGPLPAIRSISLPLRLSKTQKCPEILELNLPWFHG